MDKEQLDEVIAEVRERFPNTNFPDVVRVPLYMGRGRNITPLEDYFAIAGYSPGDEDREHPIIYAPSVSKEYQLVRHEVAVWHLLQALEDKFAEFGPAVLDPHIYKDGARLRIRMKFEEKTAEIKVGDLVGMEAGLDNSYDLSSEFSRYYGATRLACTNGMTATSVVDKSRRKHRQNLNVSDQINALAAGMEGFKGQIEEWKNWAEQDIKLKYVEPIMDSIPFGKRHQEAIRALPERTTGIKLDDLFGKKSDDTKVNVWDFHNILTQFLSHDVESDMVRLEKTEKVARVFSRHFTEGKEIKLAA